MIVLENNTCFVNRQKWASYKPWSLRCPCGHITAHNNQHARVNPLRCVLCLDFSKAFDTIRHSTLKEKMATLEIPDTAYNWMANFFSGHIHCTKYRDETSSLKYITASAVQGSGIGPAAYVANAGDLTTVTPRNKLCKFADDTYLVILAMNVNTRAIELENIEMWSRKNNITLNRSKSNEIIFTDSKKRHQIQEPSQEMDTARVMSIKILGVTMTNNLSVSTCLWHHKFMHTDSIRATSNARPWLEWFSATGRLRVDRRRQAAICVKCLVGGGFTTAADRQRLYIWVSTSQ